MTIGRYQIVKLIGRGGMGEVWLGFDPKLKRKVAIKTLRLDGHHPAARAQLEARLEREAQAAARLSHLGIVGIYDIVEENSSVSIVMQFIEGQTLDEVFPPGQPVPPGMAVRILKECAAALDYAHACNIVHRDIKPSNIMLEGTGTVRIADFGIARIVGADTFTASGVVMGTFEYMSPEQLRADAVDGRTDQFSLAMVGFHMLTGSRLYSAETMRSLAMQIATLPPPAVRLLNPSLPAAVDDVFAKALHKDRAGRYPTCSDFTSALEAAFRQHETAGRPRPKPPAAPPQPVRILATTVRVILSLACAYGSLVCVYQTSDLNELVGPMFGLVVLLWRPWGKAIFGMRSAIFLLLSTVIWLAVNQIAHGSLSLSLRAGVLFGSVSLPVAYAWVFKASWGRVRLAVPLTYAAFELGLALMSALQSTPLDFVSTIVNHVSLWQFAYLLSMFGPPVRLLARLDAWLMSLLGRRGASHLD